MITHQQCKLIHHAKRRLNMSEPDYRAMLQRVAGVTSSNDLDDASFTDVMAEMGRLGFKTVQQAPQYGKRIGMATPRQLDKIRSLWRQWAGTEDESGLKTHLERKFKVSSLRFLDLEAASKVIFALGKMAEQRKTTPRKKRR
jgi:phage gp16-like protein